jgi:uncharacterized protein (TIGR03067 family)
MTAALMLALAIGAPIEVGKDGKEAKAQKEALEKLQGIWKATAVDNLGRNVKLPGLGTADRYSFVVVGDKYVLATHAGTIKLDPAKKTIDLTITEGRFKGMTAPGIYELADDTLKIALLVPSARMTEGGRPTEFKGSAAAGHSSYTFEKDGKATKDQAAAKLKELTPIGPASWPGATGPAGPDQATQEALRRVLEKLDQIEKRLADIEKRLPPIEKK